MFDGINLQVGLYSLIVFIFFYLYNISDLFSVIMILALLLFLLLNYFSKCFLGDSGSYLLAFLISAIIIHYYNMQPYIESDAKYLYADNILILLMIPGLDMFRLFVYRVVNGKNPFEGDNEHLHHLLSSRFGLIKSNLIVQSIIIIPLLLMNIIGSLTVILISAATYTLLIFFMYRSQ